MIALLVIALPFLAAAALLVLEPVPLRFWLHLLAPVASLGGALWLWIAGAPGWQADPATAMAAAVTALVAAAAAWSDGFDGVMGWRPVRCQAVLGCLLLALLVASPAIAVLAFAAAAGLARYGNGASPLLAGGVLVAVFGLAMLGAAPDWNALLAPGGNPAALTLALPMLVLGLGVLAASPGAGPFFATLPLAALALLARVRDGVLAHPQAVAPGPLLMLIGLATLAGGAALLWRKDAALLPTAVVAQGGAALVGLGLGSPAALPHLALFSLAASAVAASRAGQGRLITAAGLALLAGLPPVGLFASTVALLVAAFARAPAVALLLAAGLVVVACAILRQVPIALAGAGSASHRAGPPGPPLAGAWVALAAALLLGLALPLGRSVVP